LEHKQDGNRRCVWKENPEMPLTPDEVSKKRFSVVFGRGYNRQEVDEFLARMSLDYSAAIQKIAAAAEGGLSADDDFALEIGEVLRVACVSARRIRDKARVHADSLIEQADAEARQLREEANNLKLQAEERADTEAKKTIEEAQKRAEEARISVERERGKVLALAQERYGEVFDHEKDLRERIGSLEKLVSEMRNLMEPLEEIDLSKLERLDVADDGETPREGLATAEGEAADVWELQEKLRAGGVGKDS
jgi:DivIVA domain-containing protein